MEENHEDHLQKYDNFLGLFDMPDKKITLKRQKVVNQREPVDPGFQEAMAVLCCKTLRVEKGKKSVFCYTIIKITFLCKYIQFLTLDCSFGKRCLLHYNLHRHLRYSIYVHKYRKNVPNFPKKNNVLSEGKF